tara:strand:+ start:1332 stop:1868 length:537 start_codon:yes stop_codon:yes gene_type:complete
MDNNFTDASAAQGGELINELHNQIETLEQRVRQLTTELDANLQREQQYRADLEYQYNYILQLEDNFQRLQLFSDQLKVQFDERKVSKLERLLYAVREAGKMYADSQNEHFQNDYIIEALVKYVTPVGLANISPFLRYKFKEFFEKYFEGKYFTRKNKENDGSSNNNDIKEKKNRKYKI